MLDILNSPMRTTVMQNGMTSNVIMEEVYRQCGAVIAFDTNGIVELAFGDNLGITVLPTFEQYDSTYQLHSFADSIMMGIKPQENGRKAAVLAELAKFLTGEECQLERYERIYWMVPSNIAALAQLSQESLLVAAMVEQSQYVVPNMLPHGTEWWDIARDIVERFENDLSNEMTLELYAQRLEDMLDPPTGIWSVYVDYLDIDMVEQPDGTWRTKEPLYLSEKDGFIIRYEHSYDQACYQETEFGYSYWKPGVAGYYHIFFDPAAWKCTWELQSQQD
jgi:arabinogalactan oligomer/maltooligosaccharide transport system substrate-binding protein